MLTRRSFLQSAGAAGLVATLAGPRSARAAAPRNLVIDMRDIEINGRPSRVFGLFGPGGKEGLEFNLGEQFNVTLQNRAGVDSLIHWHGLTPPWQQDGVPGISQPALPSGHDYSYLFPLTTPGTYWMHSHQGLQEQQLCSAPLIIHDPAEASLDRQEIVLMLHDFSFRNPWEILADLKKNAAKSSAGAMGKPDLNDVTYDAFLANGRTLRDPEVVSVDEGARLRLRIINGSASTNFTLDTGALQATLIAVDGHGAKELTGTRFPIAIAQRIDLLVELPAAGGAFPILALQEGTTNRTGIILATAGAIVPRLAQTGEEAGPVVALSLEEKLAAAQGLPERPVDQRIAFKLEGDMKRYLWTFDGVPFPEHPPVTIKQGERVEFSYQNTTMMSHPIHLHGHVFQVVGIGNRRFQGALRDTVLVPPGETVHVAFDADNPGKWAMHCHQLYHLAVGMFVEVLYQGFT
jgi:FtsP/CotA-like multicopper oxidase with cupredoxin domain